MIRENDNHLVKALNLKLPNVDFSKNYMVISGGRLVSEITYTRISKFLWPYKDTYQGNAIFENPLQPNTIFYYKTKRIPCHDDDLGKPKIIIK